MPELITISECKNYIELKSVGSPTKHDVIGAIESTLSICKRYTINKVLVDSLARNEFPSPEDQMLVAKFLGERSKGEVKFAILTNFKQIDHDFFQKETSHHNGKISYFNSKDKALEWLDNV